MGGREWHFRRFLSGAVNGALISEFPGSQGNRSNDNNHKQRMYQAGTFCAPGTLLSILHVLPHSQTSWQVYKVGIIITLSLQIMRKGPAWLSNLVRIIQLVNGGAGIWPISFWPQIPNYSSLLCNSLQHQMSGMNYWGAASLHCCGPNFYKALKISWVNLTSFPHFCLLGWSAFYATDLKFLFLLLAYDKWQKQTKNKWEGAEDRWGTIYSVTVNLPWQKAWQEAGLYTSVLH